MNFMKAKIFVTAIFLIYFTSVHGNDERTKILRYFNQIMTKCFDSSYTGISNLYNQCNNGQRLVVDLARNVKIALDKLDLSEDDTCAKGIVDGIDQMVQAVTGCAWARYRRIENNQPYSPEIWKSQTDATQNSICDYCKEIYKMAVDLFDNAATVDNLFENQC